MKTKYENKFETLGQEAVRVMEAILDAIVVAGKEILNRANKNRVTLNCTGKEIAIGEYNCLKDCYPTILFIRIERYGVNVNLNTDDTYKNVLVYGNSPGDLLLILEQMEKFI